MFLDLADIFFGRGSNLGIGFGVAQRVANVAVMVWMFIVALRLRSVAQGALAQQLCGRVEIPAATIQQSFGEGQNAPVAAGTHAGQSATPPTRAPLPRTSAEESGRGLHSVSNWESANARWLLDAVADTKHRLTWLPLKW
jgi:hypothetical protein